MITPWIRAAAARIAAVAAAAIATFLAATLGIEVTPEAHAALTEGITLLGFAFALIVYALVRPLISRFIHPSDSSGGTP